MLGKFFINFLCCGKNNVKVYKHNTELEGVELDGIAIQEETPVVEEKLEVESAPVAEGRNTCRKKKLKLNQ